MTSGSVARLAWLGLTQHKLRSCLSALGIVFGVGAVVAMLSVGEGARRAILEEVGRLGTTRVTVRSSEISANAKQEASELQSAGLNLRDAEAIAEICPDLASWAPVRERPDQLSIADRRAEGTIIGTTPEFSSTEELALATGRFLVELDIRDRKRVVVLGDELRKELAPYGDPLGELVRIGPDWFTVVGTLVARERSRRGLRLGGRNLNRIAFIPMSCIERPFDGVDEIAIRVSDEGRVRAAARLIDSIVSRLHRGAQDFEMVVPQELIAGYERTRFQFNVVVGAVAAISLLVGGIGIMNIMLANVSERIREIGVRRSLGASRRDIVLQFLAEAVLLTGSGGLVGILLGSLASYVVSQYAGWPTALSGRAFLAATFLAALTGIGFGIYPAMRAASQNPVEALRHE